MDITFDDPKLEKQCNNQKLLVRKQGPIRAKKIRQRLDDLRAADSLEEMKNLPGRCHELRGDRSGQLSLDLDGPYRLIFIPANKPNPTKQASGLDWKSVTAVSILEIENTHGK